MPKRSSAKRVFDEVLCLDPESRNDDPVLQRIADCLRTLRPLIEECSREHGHATTMVALMAVIADVAAASGEERVGRDPNNERERIHEWREA